MGRRFSKRCAVTALLACAAWSGCDGDDRWTQARDGGPSERDAMWPDADADTDAQQDSAMDARADAEPDSMIDAMPDGTTDGGEDASSDGAPPDADAGDGQVNELVCPPEAQVAEGCTSLASGDEYTDLLCDGLDNDCDGYVDEGCPCTPGDVQRCFAGPPGRADEGACQWGSQVCSGFEFSSWGPCEGGLLPSAEQCDGVDNDCNGCTDEIEECVNLVDCPGPGDPRIGSGAPFSTHTFDASKFVDPAVVSSVRWQVQGTPCDRMFQGLPGDTSSTSGNLSYTLHDPRSMTPSVDLTLSGEYAVTLQVNLVNGRSVTCNYPFQVGARGLRVELCWPESGPNSPAAGEVDLDLHLGRSDLTEEWNDEDDCHWNGCKSTQQIGGSIWGYAPSALSACTGPGASDAANSLAEAGVLTSCPNPRLDIDSADTASDAASRYPVENINTEQTGNKSFRVAVVNRGCRNNALCPVMAHPLVNVYCDSELVGSYWLQAGEVDSFGAGNTGDPTTGPRDLWRVVDIATQTSGSNTSCDLALLTDPEAGGPWIEAGENDGTLPY